MTPQEVAQIALEVVRQAQAPIPTANIDASSVPIVQWATHFVDSRLTDDHVLDAYLQRTDTSTALFEQQLEALLSKTYDKPYPSLKARTFIPSGPGIPTGAETVSSYGYDLKGEATILAGYGEDVRRVDIDGVKSTWNIVGIAAAWMMTVQQARAATMAGVDIDSKGLSAARRLIERKIDDLLTEGNADVGVDGFAALTTGATGVKLENKTGDLTGDWLTATVANTVADINICVKNFEDDAVWEPTDLLVEPGLYAKWQSLQISTGSDYTLLDWIREKYDLNVSKWNRLATADSAGTAVRAIFYVKSDEVVSSIISQEPEQLPSVWKGLGWETIMHARCGGVRVENPNGILYADYSV
jgi:hypothetical protein